MRSTIRARVECAVERWAVTADQRDGVLGALRRKSFPLHPHSRCRAGLLASLAFEAAGGTNPEVAIDAAAAVELYMAAGYVLDHVMDDEVPEESTIGRETALGTTLLLIAEATLDEVAGRALPTERGGRLVREAKQLLLRSCAGQLRELELTESSGLASMTVDDALALTELKAGSLGQMAGVVGAGLAGNEDALSALIQGCYFHFATYAQIIDDLSDAPTVSGAKKLSDFEAQRPTLPVVYYVHSQLDIPSRYRAKLGVGLVGGRTRAHRIIRGVREARAPGPEQLRESGTTLFTQLAAEVVRNRALELAEQIQRQSGRDHLVSLLRSELGEGVEPEANTAPAIATPAAS